MKDMSGYYDFSGQKFGYPLSLSINGFSQNVFTRQSSLEISYVLCGEYEAVTEQISGIVRQGELVIIAPYDMHLLRKYQDRENGKILTIHIDFERMPESMTGNLRGQFRSGIFSRKNEPSIYFQIRRKIGELVKMLMDGKSNLLRLNVLMAELVCFSAHREDFSMEELPLQSEYQENYLKAVQYIDEHFKEPLTLGDVAEQLSFSLSYASKLLKKYTGIPFSKYLAYVRVRASLEALLEGKQPIEQIALECGMPNGKAYTKTFRELYGIQPSAYRRQFRQNLRYGSEEEKPMQLDDEQKILLSHLVSEERQIVYEDEQMIIWKEQGKICCQAKEGWVSAGVTSDGTAEFLFEKSGENQHNFF